MKRRLIWVVAICPLLATSWLVPASSAAPPVAPAPVIAIVDTGINAYHREFRVAGQAIRPLTYPVKTPTLRLSLQAPSYEAAREGDDKQWGSIQDNVLYRVDGTKIIGLIRVPGRGPQDSANQISVETGQTAPRRPIIDDAGHGTSVASLAVGNRLGRCPRCNLVFVSALNLEDGLRWAASQPWIDIISNSWGGPLGVPIGGSVGGTPTTGAINEASRTAVDEGKLVLFASGNGASGTGPYAGVGQDRGLTWSSPYSGPPWVIAVGALDPTSGRPSGWHSVPVDVVAPGLATPAAKAESLDQQRTFFGTSCATPIAAGVAGEVLRRVRSRISDTGRRPPRTLASSRTFRLGALQDGTVTVDEVYAAMLGAARPPAGEPDGGPISGWGAVDHESAPDAVGLLLGAGTIDRPEATAWHETAVTARTQLWGAWPAAASAPRIAQVG